MWSLLAALACHPPETPDTGAPVEPTALHISSEQDLVVTHGGTVELDVDLTGAEVEVHFGVFHVAPATVTQTTSSLDGLRIVVPLPAPPERTPDGELWISWEGLESNHLPYFTAGWLDDLDSSVLTPGVPASVVGENLGTSGVLEGIGGGVVDAWTDTQVRFRPGPGLRPGVPITALKRMGDAGLVGNEASSLTPQVQPALVEGCAAVAGAPCVLHGGGLGQAFDADYAAAGELTVGGLAVTSFVEPNGWMPDRVAFVLPDGLAVGTHAARLTNADGLGVDFEVTHLGWLRQEVGPLPRFDDAGGTLESEATVLREGGLLYAFTANMGQTDDGFGGVNLWAAGPHVQRFGDFDPSRPTHIPLTPSLLPAVTNWPTTPWFEADGQCGQPSLGTFGNYVLTAQSFGAQVSVDPLLGRDCLGGPRVLRVEAVDATQRTAVQEITVPSGWALPAGVMVAGHHSFVLALDGASGGVTPWLAAGLGAPPFLQQHWDYASAPLVPGVVMGYAADERSFYLGGGVPGWSGLLYRVLVEQGVNLGGVPTLTPVELPPPTDVASAAAERLTAFTGALDGSLWVVDVPAPGTSQLHRWSPDQDAWDPPMVGPSAEVIDLAVLDGVPYVLVVDQGLYVVAPDGAGGWEPLGEELTSWWARWSVCSGPLADPGPEGGQGDCTLEERPVRADSWRPWPATPGRARLQATSGELLVSYDTWYTGSRYAGDLGQDRQMVAIWRP